MVRGDGLAVELGEQNVRDGAVDGFRRVLKDVGETNMQAALAETNSGVQRGKAAEADVEGRNRGSRAKFAVLLLKQRRERGGLGEGGHSFRG